ncbi:MAG TPA: LPXTG cell wall anchor domain-containing protein [Candidatus Blautia intestinigallinarum]|nr:LPXTG cell wall anchor domain-containing protein [Candidatus Blautia intestinigallinarum]
MESKSYILVIAGIYMLVMILIGFVGKKRLKKQQITCFVEEIWEFS